MPDSMTLETFAAEQKGLFKDLMEKVKAKADQEATMQLLEGYKADHEALVAEVKTLQTAANRPAAERKDGLTEAEAEYVKHYDKWVRKGIEPPEQKDLSTNPDTEGGYFMPRNVANTILTSAANFAPIRQVARVINIGQGDSFEQPAIDNLGFGIGRVGEKSARTKTATGAASKINIWAHEYYAEPALTQKMIDDVTFSIEGLVQMYVEQCFNVLVAEDYVVGDGQDKAHGFTTKVTTSVLSGTAATSTIKGMLLAYAKLKPAYRRRGTYAMNANTLAAIILDGSTKYQAMLSPNVQTATGLSFMGRPILEFPELDDDGATKYPIYFGDFSYYFIVDRQGIRTLRDPYTDKPNVLLYTTWRTGGDLVLPEAFVKVKSNNS